MFGSDIAETWKAVVDWIGAIATTNHQFYDSCLSSRLAGTCEWILSKPAYLWWCEEPELRAETAKLLWINGPAGFGKTVLCASLIKRIQSEWPQDPVAFFFFSGTTEARDDPLAAVRSWLSQLAAASPDAFTLVTENISEKNTGVASASEVWSLLAIVARDLPRCVFVLDGLDECMQVDDRRKGFLAQLKRCVAHTAARILIVSRDEVDIRSELTPPPHQENDDDSDKGDDHSADDALSSVRAVRLAGIALSELPITETDVYADVGRFSRSVVDRKIPNKQPALRAELAAQMTAKSAGMFLWINLQRECLRPGKNPKQLHEAVQQMPPGLVRAYERNWADLLRQEGHDRCRALAILRWAAFALRPLTVGELTEALVVHVDDDDCDKSDGSGSDDTGYGDDDLRLDELPDMLDKYYVDDQIVDLCRSLVVVRGGPDGDTASKTQPASDAPQPLSSQTVHLAHFSVREFLLAVSPPLPQGVMRGIDVVPFADLAAQNNHLATLCLRYLQYPTVWATPRDARPFLDYAARLWQQHATRSGSRRGSGGGGGFGLLKYTIAQFFRCGSSKWVAWRDYVEQGASVASAEANVEAQTQSAAPLYYAALYGFWEIVDVLLADGGVDVNAVGGTYGTALQAASANGHLETVKGLVRHGADVDVRVGRFGCALNAAANAGRENIVRVFVDMGASLDVRDPDGRSAVYLASWHGHRGVVQLLLENGADISAVNKWRMTPLHVAAAEGHLAVVELLLDRGAYIAAANEDGWTALFYAADEGRLEVVRLLVDRGDDVSRTAAAAWTALNSAALEGHVEIVQLLLDHGADLSIADDTGDTPLLSASRGGHLEVVRLLLDCGANVSAANEQGWTPLNLAAHGGHVGVAKLLLERGAVLSQAAEEGWTALISAVARRHTEVVQLLLDHSADPSAAFSLGWTPLMTAAYDGQLDIVKLLLSGGADTAAVTDEGANALYYAANEGHADVVALLLDRGADLSAGSGSGWTPLDAAVDEGHVEIIKLLLDRGADVSAANIAGWTVLHAAAYRGRLDVVRLLCDRGADVCARSSGGWMPLSGAAREGHVEVVRLLLERGADVAAANEDALTPLNDAADEGHGPIVELLLDHGADMAAATTKGMTPLHSAAAKGHVGVVKLLLDRGADVTIANTDGLTPLDLAAQNGHAEVVKLLSERTNKPEHGLQDQTKRAEGEITAGSAGSMMTSGGQTGSPCGHEIPY